MRVKMIKNLESKMKRMQESISKDLEELKTKHAETNTITEREVGLWITLYCRNHMMS